MLFRSTANGTIINESRLVTIDALSTLTFITAGGASLTFDDVVVDIEGDSARIQIGGSLIIETPDVQTGGIVSVGDVLTLTNTNGIVEYKPLVNGSYADDAAAGVGGVTTGQLYQASGAGVEGLGVLMVKQ